MCLGRSFGIAINKDCDSQECARPLSLMVEYTMGMRGNVLSRVQPGRLLPITTVMDTSVAHPKALGHSCQPLEFTGRDMLFYACATTTSRPTPTSKFSNKTKIMGVVEIWIVSLAALS